MDKIIAFFNKEPAVVWTSSGAAIVGAIQADPLILQDWKNWLSLAITVVGFIIRQSVTPAKS
jgi:hypothetical protein